MIKKSSFLLKYGHLRPGTYDISSYRYDEMPNLYFDWGKKKKLHLIKKFNLNANQIYKLEKYLNEYELEQSPIGLFHFIKSVVEAREYAKFIFSKSISEILVLITNIGRKPWLYERRSCICKY